MRTIETVVTVDEQGTAVFRMTPDVTPGEHHVVVVIDETRRPRAPLIFASHDVGPWPKGFTASRERLFDDDGRCPGLRRSPGMQLRVRQLPSEWRRA